MHRSDPDEPPFAVLSPAHFMDGLRFYLTLSIESPVLWGRSGCKVYQPSKVPKIMEKRLVAKASTAIDAPVATVWNALVDPVAIEKYMLV